jgi:hypothetical protein
MQVFWYIIIIILALAIGVVAWVFRWNIRHLRRHNYADLVEEKNTLYECVVDWRYPDGTFVPQEKRQQMFRDLQRLSRKIRNHPDNPDNIA